MMLSQLTIRRGRYSLAPRSLMELELYLKDQYEDYIYTCQRCSKIVLTVSCSLSASHHSSFLQGIKCEHGNCELSFPHAGLS